MNQYTPISRSYIVLDRTGPVVATRPRNRSILLTASRFGGNHVAMSLSGPGRAALGLIVPFLIMSSLAPLVSLHVLSEHVHAHSHDHPAATAMGNHGRHHGHDHDHPLPEVSCIGGGGRSHVPQLNSATLLAVFGLTAAASAAFDASASLTFPPPRTIPNSPHGRILLI
jgi:hypothetical protein